MTADAALVGLDGPGAGRAPAEPRLRRQHRLVRNAIWYDVLTALSFVVLFPVYMTLVRALSVPTAYYNAGSPLHPVSVDWGVFRRAWDQGGLGGPMLRSLLVTLIITSAQLVTATMAAYAFAFLDFAFKRTFFALFMSTLLLPIEVTLIANNETIRHLHWANSYQGLVAPFLATAFGTFLIRQGFLGVPHEIRDASRLDGYGHVSFLARFAVPLTRPVIASFTVISFLSAWNQYLWPRTVVDKGAWATLQIAVRGLASNNPQTANIGPAGALLAALPIVVLLVLFQRQIIRGLTAGAVKG
jgi:sn-glycerol 3-phosphate transport system permease protein